MDHSRISNEEWDLVKYKLIKNAYITKVWADTEGEIHMELTYPVDTTPKAQQDAQNVEVYEKEVDASNSILRRNRYNTKEPYEWFGPDPEPEHEVKL